MSYPYDKLFAHTPAAGSESYHRLSEHLHAVGDKAYSFAAKYQLGELAKVLGLAHDIAKADQRFQQYLRDCFDGKPSQKCPHAVPSAAAVSHTLGVFAINVAGHHVGMPDRSDLKAKLERADAISVNAAREFVKLIGIPEDVKSFVPKWANQDPLAAEMMIRMLNSALVDADYLDTEAHFANGKESPRGKYPPLPVYKERLDAYMQSFEKCSGKVNEIRNEILGSCRASAGKKKGGFRLTVPTGGGKTLSGLSFALDHAISNEMDRVIVAIPFTSIIDQTADLYRAAVGDENVLEHHSAIDVLDQEGQSEHETKRRLAVENWDCPLVVTTTVQLFESLFSNRPGPSRKLHNIAKSVIVLDEVQAVPPNRLQPILDVLHELVSHYGCSVVFCTATQPDYGNVDDRLWSTAKEIVPDYPRHFESLKRVHIEIVETEWPLQRVIEEIESNQRVLAVFNSKRDAADIARRNQQLEGIYHLSTLMCGHHRREVLAKVKEELKGNRPVRLISTQVVEAGVDVDFPFVMRHLGPLSSIVQAAGRCNREGKSELGRCLVFTMEGSSSPSGDYKLATQKTKMILQTYEDPMSPEAMGQYFREFFALSKQDAGIQAMRRDMKFESVAAAFKMIEDETHPLVIESYSLVDVGELIARDSLSPRQWFRQLAPFTVQVSKRVFTHLLKSGIVHQHDLGAWIYSGPYDSLLGLSPELTDPRDLIIE